MRHAAQREFCFVAGSENPLIHCRKEHLKISKMTAFASHIFTNRYSVNSHNFKDVCLYGEGHVFPTTIQTSAKLGEFSELPCISSLF